MASLSLSQSIDELKGILALQRENLIDSLSQVEKAKEGFVTVQHTLEQLQDMQRIAPHVIAKENNQVVGYVLAMTLASKLLVPLLVPLFENFERLALGGKVVTHYQPMIVGQVCVGKSQRGTGLFKELYDSYRHQYASNYDFAITSIAISNYRSLAAHQRIGFEVLHTFEDSIQPWAIVYWDWNNCFSSAG